MIRLPSTFSTTSNSDRTINHSIHLIYCNHARLDLRIQQIPVLYRNKSSSKRNDSSIGFIVLIPEQLLHSGKDLQKIRLITKWYSSTRLTNAYARIVKLFEIYYTNDFGFLPPLNLIGKLLLHNVQNSLKL